MRADKQHMEICKDILVNVVALKYKEKNPNYVIKERTEYDHNFWWLRINIKIYLHNSQQNQCSILFEVFPNKWKDKIVSYEITTSGISYDIGNLKRSRKIHEIIKFLENSIRL